MAARSITDRPPDFGEDHGTQPGRVLIAGRCSETIYRQRRILALALREQGWDVHLCGDAGDPRYGQYLAAEGFTFHPLTLKQNAKSPLAAVRLILAYRRIMRSVRPDVVHVFNAKPTVMGLIGSALGRRTARIATIAGLGHVFMARSLFVRKFGQGAFRAALSFADAVIFYNEDDRRTFLEGHLVPERKAHLIQGSGIDLERFAAIPLPQSDQLEVLFIGRLLREKGVVEVIAAGHELRRRGAGIRITLVGDIDFHNPSSLSRADIDAAVAGQAVTWKGALHDVVPAIAASHVIVLPSQREGIPLALVEGGAMARALVATNVPGCRDVVQHERNGLLVPLGDVQALVDALARLAGDRCLLERLAEGATRSVRQRFGADAVSERVGALYASTLAALRRDRSGHPL